VRLPGKPLLEIKGLPLVMWAFNRARDSGAFSDVAVATDDQRIYDAVRRHGGEVVMTSPAHASGTDRVNEAAAALGADFVVNLQGDEPLVPVELLVDFCRELVRLDEKSLLTIVSNATIEEMSDPNVVKAVLAGDGRALYFSRSPIPYTGRSEDIKAGYRHIGIYGFSKESLSRFCGLPQGYLERIEKLEQLRALEAGMTIRCLTREYRGIGIDTPADLEAFRRLVGGAEGT
jgi:3-deoxy-manno-octulosonate cytidylyltransferase (CMP-KDO synthetase)